MADDAMTTFRTTLRRLAVEQDQDERLRLSNLLASQLEVTFDRQSDITAAALSDTEEVLLSKIDRLNEQVGDSNLLLVRFLENFPSQLATFQAEMRAAVAEETARGLGKFGEDIDALRAGQAHILERLHTDERRLDAKRVRIDRHEQRLDDQQRAIDELRQIVAARPAQRAAEHAALVEAIVERLRVEIDGDR